MSQQQQSMDIDHFINRRLTRSGWFFLVVVISLLFLSLYLLVPNLSQRNKSNVALEERLQQLEKKVEHLESILSTTSSH